MAVILYLSSSFFSFLDLPSPALASNSAFYREQNKENSPLQVKLDKKILLYLCVTWLKSHGTFVSPNGITVTVVLLL